jgi:hypothetical protein
MALRAEAWMTRTCKQRENDCQLEGRYANCFKIGYNAFEFLMDFGQAYRDEDSERFHTRIVTSPAYVKTLLSMLGGAVHRYEKSFGEIPQRDDDAHGEGN